MSSYDPSYPGDDLYQNLSYHHLSNFYAPSALATTLINAFCLGIVLYDTFANVPFDLYLVKSPGWRNPIKIINRLAYFSIRLLTLLYLSLMLVYLNVEISVECKPLFTFLFLIWYITVMLIDVIFISRTLALYEWSKVLSAILFTLYASYVSIGLYGVSRWGDALRLSGTHFCSYIAKKPTAGTLERLFEAFFAITTFTDVLILVLTCKRLASQISSAKLLQGGRPRYVNRLSRALFVQGFVLYGSLCALKLGFILFHYLTDYRQFWILFGMGAGLTIAYITASILVRQTSNIAQEQATNPALTSSQNCPISPRPVTFSSIDKASPTYGEQQLPEYSGYNDGAMSSA